MTRGINEKDVFKACDALVLAGERPTIERVRQKIGRGSPNTVSPMLDAWFKGLGLRLQDPGAFAPPSDVPEPVLQAAQHFWEVAQASARADVEQQVSERLAPMQAEVDRAQHAETLAHAERDAEAARIGGLRQELADAGSLIEAERVTHAATAAREQAARDQVAALNTRLAAAEAQLRETEDRSRREAEAAQERATGAERRAAMEIENERAARGRADKRADTLEKRVEALQATSANHLEELVASKTSLEHERREIERLRANTEEAVRQLEVADAALVEARLAIERAEAEARTTRTAMAQLLPLISDAQRKRSPRGGKKHSAQG